MTQTNNVNMNHLNIEDLLINDIDKLKNQRNLFTTKLRSKLVTKSERNKSEYEVGQINQTIEYIMKYQQNILDADNNGTKYSVLDYKVPSRFKF